MNTANKMTLFRILLIPVMVVLFYVLGKWGGIAAAIVFTVASITDFLDGFVARKYNQTTDFGKIFDPLADKLLVTAALVILVEVGGMYPVWGAVSVIVILMREIVIGVIRQLAAVHGTIIAAATLGKLKTVFLNVAIICLLLVVPGSEIAIKEVYISGNILLGIAVVLSIISLVVYFSRNKNLMKNATKIKEVRLLNAGVMSSARPEPGTVFAVQEQYPQKNEPVEPRRPQPQPQPPQQKQPQTAPHAPYTNINLVNNISKDKLTKDIFDNIMLYVIATETVSIAKIQEKFQIGYRIAQDAIDKMEELHYITKLTPTSRRRILITRDEYIAVMKQNN